MKNVSKAAYWDQIYREESSPGWDLGAPAPALFYALSQERFKPGYIAVPGCGYGHDARLLAGHGFKVDAFDISARALAGARRWYSKDKAVKGVDAGVKKLRFIKANLFDLPKRYAGKFDYIYEYTCFCAIDPKRRAEYAQAVHAILKPGGMLFGCFYHHGREGGPPFDVTKAEVKRTFSPLFKIHKLAVTPHSVERRKGAELWAEFMRK